MSILNTIHKEFPERVMLEPKSLADIPRKDYLVYILERNGQAIVVGHGKFHRARVIFDDERQITASHLKALYVRLYRLFAKADDTFVRYIIICRDKADAATTEKRLHQTIGGNRLTLPTEIEAAVADGFSDESLSWRIVRMALASSFDGLADLAKWRRLGLIPDEAWSEITNKLRLDSVAKRRRKASFGGGASSVRD